MNFRLHKKIHLLIFAVLIYSYAATQNIAITQAFTHQDTLRGSIGKGRSWWDVLKYDINIDVNITEKFISGYTDITFRSNNNTAALMQIDLQEPMQIEKIENKSQHNEVINFKREGNVYWLDVSAQGMINIGENKFRIFFNGHPKEAKHAPWDGGWVWAKDSLGRPFVTAACQGLGASVWYPCKDHQSDEPDNGATLTISVPDSLVAVGNGRLTSKKQNANGKTTWQWTVVNPINNYLIIPYIGKYVNFTEEMQGEKGKLNLSYWVLDYNLEKAKKHFAIVKPMIQCFEEWMGPYPFYEDSYKLVEAPHLGMEHQSAVAYGNKYINGYRGLDRSGTGWGKDWDFIIVHESGHEWFANNITSKDIADMWIHESFTTYSETMFVQCRHGLKAANEYVMGQRRNITNGKPIIGRYGVNDEGGDLYDKGANMIHTIRQIINDDMVFKNIIRGLNKDFYHQTVTTQQIENYISKKSGKDFSKVFDQYLRTTNIPILEYDLKGENIEYKWANCINGFNMPVKLTNDKWIYPTEKIKTISIKEAGGKDLLIDPNFYITVQKNKY